VKLEDKVAIVTAAGRGIGRGIALCLAEEGASVVVNSYQEETTQSTVAKVEKTGRKSLGIAGDITKPDVILKVIDGAIKTFGRIDILVNNVGLQSKTPKEPGSGPLGETITQWDSGYQQNLRATVLMCEAIAPHFTKQKSGKIVNISSVAGKFGFPTHGDWYSSMKAGLIRYSQGLADRLGPSNINVNCVCPGIVYTDAYKTASEMIVKNQPEFKGLEPREWFVGVMEGKYQFPSNFPTPVTPMKREQTVEDIGRAVVFLVSDDSRNVTGQSFNVDGGIIKS
jgi:NAD(P)-dependent dehydrogenase (short-subunit alcohol dehydrogenase family)